MTTNRILKDTQDLPGKGNKGGMRVKIMMNQTVITMLITTIMFTFSNYRSPQICF